jgi:hypothetical protein
MKLAASKVNIERSQAALVEAKAEADTTTEMLKAASSASNAQIEQLTDHLLAHSTRTAYADSATALESLVREWRHAWEAATSKGSSKGGMVATLEAQLEAAEGILEDATVKSNIQKAQVERLEAKLNEGINGEQLNAQSLETEERRLAAKEGQLGVVKNAAVEAKQNSAATSADLLMKQRAAGVATAEQMLQQATNQYQSAIQQVKDQMMQEHELSIKIGHTEGKIETLEDKVEQLDSSINEANEDLGEQQAALDEAIQAQRFAIAQDKQSAAKVEALAHELRIPEESSERTSSLTIRSNAPKTAKLATLPGSVSVTPVFLQALETASEQAELQVAVTEAKRLYTKLTLVRTNVFNKLQAQRAVTSALSEQVAEAGSAAVKIEAEVHGLVDESTVLADEMNSDQNQMNQTSAEQEHIQEVEDNEEMEGLIVNNQLADAQATASIGEATEQEEQHNLLIEETFAEKSNVEQQQLAATEKAHISTLGPKVDAARDKASELAAAVDNANYAAAEASQAKAAAKELLAAAQLASAGVSLQAEQVELEAQALYNQTAQKIANTAAKVSELTRLASRAHNQSEATSLAAFVDVDVNLTVIGLYAEAVAKKPISDGILEAIAQVTQAEVERVKIDVLRPCNVLAPRAIPYCTTLVTHAQLPMYDAAASAVSAIETRLELDGEEGLSDAMQEKWRIKGKFASVKLYMNGTDVRDPAMPYKKARIDTGEDTSKDYN